MRRIRGLLSPTELESRRQAEEALSHVQLHMDNIAKVCNKCRWASSLGMYLDCGKYTASPGGMP